jgi:hypothetical protein
VETLTTREVKRSDTPALKKKSSTKDIFTKSLRHMQIKWFERSAFMVEVAGARLLIDTWISDLLIPTAPQDNTKMLKKLQIPKRKLRSR